MSGAALDCRRLSMRRMRLSRGATLNHCPACALSGPRRSFLLRREHADLDAAVEGLVVRRGGIGRGLPAFSFDIELVRIEFVFFDERALDRFCTRQTEIPHGSNRDLSFHAGIGMTF